MVLAVAACSSDSGQAGHDDGDVEPESQTAAGSIPGDPEQSSTTAAAPSTTSAKPPTTVATTTTNDPILEAIEAGYVAKCNDGGLSDNTDFRATCSGGDGIDRWLGPFGQCNDGHVIAMAHEATCEGHDGFQTVLPPDFMPSPSDDDIAECANGTFSDNTDLNAICSANGGVAQWLAPYGECDDGTVIEMGQGTCDGHGRFATLLAPDFIPTSTTTTSTPPVPSTSAPGYPIASFCEDRHNDGAGNFDLTDSGIERFQGGYRLTASYVGPSQGRLVTVVFELGGFKYTVGGKKYQDGSSDAYVFDFRASRNLELTDQMVLDNFVSLGVTDAQVRRLAGRTFGWSVFLEADGLQVDECTGASTTAG
jgi:hypothetical protein